MSALSGNSSGDCGEARNVRLKRRLKSSPINRLGDIWRHFSARPLRCQPCELLGEVVEEIRRNLNWVPPLRLSSTDKWNEEDYGGDEDYGMHPSQRRIRIRR